MTELTDVPGAIVYAREQAHVLSLLASTRSFSPAMHHSYKELDNAVQFLVHGIGKAATDKDRERVRNADLSSSMMHGPLGREKRMTESDYMFIEERCHQIEKVLALLQETRAP